MEPRPTNDAFAAALRAHLPAILTEPLPATRLAEWFGVSRNLVPLLMESIDGTERVPGGYRVPLLRMPPAYFRDRGLVAEREFRAVHDSARSRTSRVPPPAEP